MSKSRTNHSLIEAELALDQEVRLARSSFRRLRLNGHIDGEFDDDQWKYGGTWLKFVRLADHTGKREPLSGAPKAIARCALAYWCTVGRSPQQLKAVLIAVRALEAEVGDSMRAWSLLSDADLDKTLMTIRNRLAPESDTPYFRGTNMSLLVRYISGIQHYVDGVMKRFLAVPLRWRCPLKNPTTAREDPTTEEFRRHREKKFVAELEVAMGALHSRAIADPSAEPKPGLALIRIEAMAFVLALGIRAGELISLPKNCLTDRPGHLAVRVWTEKTHVQSTRELPELWHRPVLDAHAYLLSACAEARARAKLIEDQGFGWVKRRLMLFRSDNPLEDKMRSAMKFAGLDPDDVFTVGEVCRCFKLVANEFTCGTYKPSTVRILGTSITAILGWIDQRFRCWDWRDYASEKRAGTRATSGRNLTVSDVGIMSGAPRSAMCKFRDLTKGMRPLLLELKRIGAFSLDTSARLPEDERSRLREAWSFLRDKIASGERRWVRVVVVTRWSQQLAWIYDRNLERLYGKNVNGGRLTAKASTTPASTHVPLSSHLLVVWENQFKSRTRSMGMLPQGISRPELYNFLVAHKLRRTAFDIYDVRRSDGSVFSVTPHQVRHWLTTAVLRAGASETVVDVWMGRKPGQSRQYDHRTAHERAEEFRKLYMAESPPGDYLGSRVVEWRDQGVGEAEIAEIIETRLQILHFVPWGMCSRDLVLAPCNKGLMCLRGFGTDKVCKSFHIDPSDQAARLAIEELHRKYTLQLRVFEPNVPRLRTAFEESFEGSSVLDQHVQMMLSILTGCEAALAAYAAAERSVENAAIRVLDFVSNE